MRRLFTRPVFAFLIFTSFWSIANPAFAFDQQSILKQFQDYARQNQIVFTFQSAETVDNTSLLIKNLDYFDEKKQQRQQIEKLTLGELKLSEGGQISYETLEAENLVLKPNNGPGTATIKMNKAFAKQLTFQTDGSGKSALWPTVFGDIEASDIELEFNRDKNKVLIKFPSAKIADMETKTSNGFFAGLIELSAGSGTSTTSRNTAEFKLGAMRLENAERFGLSGFEIGKLGIGAVEVKGANVKGDEVAILFDGLSVTNFYSPDATQVDRPLVSDKELKAEIKPLSVSIKGKSVVGWVRGYATTQNDLATGLFRSEGGIEDVYLDFAALPDNPRNARTIAMLKELDLLKMIMDFTGKGTWNKGTGDLEITDYKIEVENNAALNIKSRMTGYTEQVARNFSTTLNAMNAETDASKRNTLGLQALAHLAGLSIQYLEISIDDQSLLDRVISLQAQKLNQEPDQIRGIVGPMTTIVLAPYNIPELSAQMGQALGTFMQGNKTLTLVAEPNGGLAITEIIALSSGLRAGAINPADLAQRLNLKVSAE